MKQITRLYCNDFGMSFYWLKENMILAERVQLVFKETGFYFTVPELQAFVALIEDSSKNNKCCDDCALKNRCHKFLLKTPCPQIDLAVSIHELDAIRDLVHGTLFTIALQEFLNGVGRN